MATLLKWKTLEFEHHQKGLGWYILLGIVALILIGYEIFFRHDIYPAITFLIIAAMVFAFARQSPQEVEITVTDKGISVDNFHIHYNAITRFWMVDLPDRRSLHLETTAYLNRVIIVQLADQNPEEVAKVLRRFIIETEPNRESLANRIARKLRF